MVTNAYKKGIIHSDIQYFINKPISTNKTKNLTHSLKIF